MAKNVKINSVVYAEVPQVSIPLAEGQGTAVFYDTTGATAASGDILTGKSAFIGNGFVAGSMPNNGAVSGSISKADGCLFCLFPFSHSASFLLRCFRSLRRETGIGSVRRPQNTRAHIMPLRIRQRTGLRS